MSLMEDFIHAIRNGEAIDTVGGKQADGKLVDAPVFIDSGDLEAITKEAIRQGLLPPDTDPDEALRLIDEAFDATP
jgi:hypothetical protein